MNQSLRPIPGPNAAQPLDPADGGRMLAALWQAKWRIMAVVAVFMLLGAVYASQIAQPIYVASARVLLDPSEENTVDLDSVIASLGRDETAVNSEVEVLRSRGLIGTVVDELGLVDNPAFNPYLRAQASPTIRAGLVRVGILTAPTTVAPDPQSVRDAVIDRVQRSLTVQSLPKSTVFVISVRAPDGALAADIANTLAAVYSQAQVSVKFDANAQATDWLRGRVEELKHELEQAEAAVRAFAASNELVDEVALEAANRQLTALRARNSSGVAGAVPATQITEMAALLARQSADIVHLQQLEREAEASRSIYEYFLNRLKETAIQLGVHQPDSRLISDAPVPLNPAWPNKPLILALAGLLGAFLAMALVMRRTLSAAAYRSARVLEATVGLSVLGQIPRMRARRGVHILDQIQRNPSCELAEAMRDLRTSILMQDKPPQVILLTSALPGEGKTTQSLLLAQSLSALGHKVLLIEGDIRRPSIARILNVPTKAGLMQVLGDDLALEDAVVAAPGAGFDILLGAPGEINAADMFAADRFGRLLTKARKTYAFIIIDSAPILLVPDARIIAPLADAILFCVQWDQTPQSDVQRGLRALQGPKRPVPGLILSQVDGKRMASYGYGAAYGDQAHVSAYFNG